MRELLAGTVQTPAESRELLTGLALFCTLSDTGLTLQYTVLNSHQMTVI